MTTTDIELLHVVWNYLVQNDPLPAKADAIVVGGCKDLAVAERAAELYNEQRAPLIIMSGYHDPNYDIPMSEAVFFAERAQACGVPRAALVIEDQARNTGENISFSAALLDRPAAVILVHKPYMTMRFLATAEAQWPAPQPRFYVTSEKTTLTAYLKRRGDAELSAILGDLQRMQTYATRGFQSYREVPDDVQWAFAELLRRGYSPRGS